MLPMVSELETGHMQRHRCETHICCIYNVLFLATKRNVNCMYQPVEVLRTIKLQLENS